VPSCDVPGLMRWRKHWARGGMARFLQQFDPDQGDCTAERSRILGNPSVDAVMDEVERRCTGSEPKQSSFPFDHRHCGILLNRIYANQLLIA